jgi:hypothetical protein
MYVHDLQIILKMVLIVNSGRTVPGGCVAIRLGRSGYWIVHRIVSRGSSMVLHLVPYLSASQLI